MPIRFQNSFRGPMKALHRVRMPIRMSTEVNGLRVSVVMNSRITRPIRASHQPEKPSRYRTKMKPV